MRFLLILLLFPTIVLSCPLIGGLPDFNCDQKMNVVVIGDSFVYGIGDTVNKNKGGYIVRAQNKLPDITITGLGVPGLQTPSLIKSIKAAFKNDKITKLKTALMTADYVVLDLGRNDRWFFGEPLDTLKNLKAIRTLIRRNVAKEGGVAPFVVTSVLMLPNRGSQGPWVKALNVHIRDSDSVSAPANLRFDLVSKRLISSDQIHPTSKGYDSLARVFVKYLTLTLPSSALLQKADSDNDAVFDEFEISKYSTDPTKYDSDGDGKSDGYEIFTSLTNPNDPSQ